MPPSVPSFAFALALAAMPMHTVVLSRSSSRRTPSLPRRGLTTALWVAQVVLAAVFAFSGLGKITQPASVLALDPHMAWVTALPHALLLFIGVVEVAGAVGLILPALTRIAPVLTPFAAAGLALVMVGAAGFHGMRGELDALPVNFVLGGVAVFVAWGRLLRAPIAKRLNGVTS
jgi:uncharacterized membrane protein YphA (DoxX/SURF4 family)